jgi:hypothetical protein
MGGRPLLKGWRYVAFVGSIVGAISVAIYPIIIMPYLNPEPWQKHSKMVRSIRAVCSDICQSGFSSVPKLYLSELDDFLI